MNRRGFMGVLAGIGALLTLGRTKPPEAAHEGVSGHRTGRKLYAVTDWGHGSDVAVTVVYWRGEDGSFYIQDMHECTSEQIEDGRCPCRRYFPGHRVHDEDMQGRFLKAGGEFEDWKPIVLPLKI